MPPTLFTGSTDSLGEMAQRELPGAKVVKTLNTVNCDLMVDARSVADGEHHMFVAGNDAAAKAQVTDILKSWFGWKHVLDLGDITTARGASTSKSCADDAYPRQRRLRRRSLGTESVQVAGSLSR